VIGGVAQAVMDVDGGDVTPGSDGERHQRGGVGPAGEPAGDRRSGRREIAALEESGGVGQGNASVCDPYRSVWWCDCWALLGYCLART
jgi:hypothetical protein